MHKDEHKLNIESRDKKHTNLHEKQSNERKTMMFYSDYFLIVIEVQRDTSLIKKNKKTRAK